MYVTKSKRILSMRIESAIRKNQIGNTDMRFAFARMAAYIFKVLLLPFILNLNVVVSYNQVSTLMRHYEEERLYRFVIIRSLKPIGAVTRHYVINVKNTNIKAYAGFF